jgi:hypothetical protein
MRARALLLGLLLTTVVPAHGAAERFRFAIPWDDASQTAVSAASLNPAPLTEKHRVVIENGHFYDQTGRRVRFVGTNLAAGACFPRKEDAPKVAARMHKFAFNIVRLHHMDAAWADPNIFYLTGGSYGRKTEHLDPQSLDRLDYLIYQLKQHGIYVDINLHVSRTFTAEEGFPDTDRIDSLGKVVGYFEPRMIERQKLYAEQLLAHYNPYTKTKYVDDPAVALIEITNEDSLLGSAGSIAALPEHYRNILSTGWHEFLRGKYGSTAAMLAAWNADAQPLGESMLRNPGFEEDVSGWTLETHGQTSAEMGAEEASGEGDIPPGRVLHLTNLRLDDTDWHLQLHQVGLDLQDGRLYTVSFAARSDALRSMVVSTRHDEEPWGFVGLDERVSLTPQWKRYAFTFVARDTRPSHTRLSFVIGMESGDIYLADLSLQPGGGGVELAPGQSLEAGNLDLPAISDTPRGRDWVEYLIDVESKFTQGMYDHVKKALGARGAVTCSQASYGGLGGVWRESHMDWVDMHSYWQHPWFPNQPWDSNDYRTGNTSMVRDRNGGTLSGLAMHRVAGKPFTVSEYDHPYPNEYAAEMVPMVFAYAAWQDWDGVFLFAYHGDDAGWDRNRIDSFFDQSAHPGKLAFVPAAARMFLSGCVGPAPGEQTLVVPEGQVVPLTARAADWFSWSSDRRIGNLVSAADFLQRRTAVRFVKGNGPLQLERKETKPASPATRLTWQTADPAEALFTVDSPCAKAVVGFAGGRSVKLSGLIVAMKPTERNFISLMLAVRDGKPTESSRSLLLTAVDKVENPGLEWNAERTFAANAWGPGPTLAQTVPATVIVWTKMRKAEVYALDATGKRAKKTPSSLINGRLSFSIGPEDKALWYEVAGS